MDHTVPMSTTKKFLLLVIPTKNQMSLQTAKFAANPVQQAKANKQQSYNSQAQIIILRIFVNY